MTGYEEQLLTRAEVLEDTGELVQSVTAVLAGAQGAGVDPAAVTSLAAAVRALDPGASTGYNAGSKKDRQPGGGYGSDGEFLEARPMPRTRSGSGCGEDREQLPGAARRPPRLDAAQAALDAAYAMPVKDECDGCHGDQGEAAIADARSRRHRRCARPPPRSSTRSPAAPGALGRLRQVPQDLGEVYELVYRSSVPGGNCPGTGAGSKGRAREAGGNPPPAPQAVLSSAYEPSGHRGDHRGRRRRPYCGRYGGRADFRPPRNQPGHAEGTRGAA